MFRLGPAVALVAGSAALAASAPVPAPPSPIASELQQARAEAAAAANEQARLEKAAAEAGDKVTQLRASQLAAAQAVSAAEARITAADAEAKLIEAHLAAQRQILAARQAPASALLGGLVLASRRPPLLMLADSGSAEDLIRLRVLVSATAPAIAAKTAALSSELRQQSRLEQSAIAARNRMLASRRDLQRRRDALATLEQRAMQVAATRRSEALGAGDIALARGERVAAMQRTASSAEQSRKLASELAAVGAAPLVNLPGNATQPLSYRLPADSQVIDGMGAVSANGVRSRGITLATRRGTPLVAPAAGTILFAGPFRDYDGVIIIDHGDGWKSVLVNAGSKLQRGAKVRLGQPLGVALGPLQVQLQHGGEPVSPALIAGSSHMLSNQSKGG